MNIQEAIAKLEVDKRPVEPGQSFEVGLMKEGDAWAVARCFFAVFGAGYAFPAYFDPDYLTEATRDGSIQVIVARTACGDVVGCGFLYHSSAPNQRVFELGRYLVLPDYRTTDAALEIQRFLVETLMPSLEADHVFGEAVCHQVVDQKFWAMGKFREHALEVGLMPASAYGLEGDRVSALLQFQSVREKELELYLPGEYDQALTFILGDRRRRIKPAVVPIPSDGRTRISSEYYAFAQVSRFNILGAGPNFIRTIQDLEDRAIAEGARVVEFFIDLGRPWCGPVVTYLRAHGYFLGGLVPGWFGTDGLLMQRVLDLPDLDAIKLFSERAHKILGFIRKDLESNPACRSLCKPRVAAPAPDDAPGRGRADAVAAVELTGTGLTVEQVAAVARLDRPVKLTGDPAVLERFEASSAYIRWGVKTGEPIYGVNTGFGGMANVAVPEADLAALQTNLIHFLHAGTGGNLARQDVRAAMLVRANSHLRGVSGIRRELVERMLAFLNGGATPVVRDLGSIGASGDLVPLATMTGAITGLDGSFLVDLRGERVPAPEALRKLGLEPISLGPKEGLAMVNGTSVMSGIAANCLYEGRQQIAIALACHALYLQALRASNQSFHPFVQEVKPHPGQVWTAAQLLSLVRGSRMVRNELDGHHDSQGDQPAQDRYSLRCLPQYLGPIVDGFRQAVRVVEVEVNSASDNPIIDGRNAVSYHTGNFLGSYVGVWMDHFRYYLGLLAKHLDTQIALLVAPEFNGGLPPSLVGNPERGVNMGLKGLQISANSMMPLISFYGNSIADRYPTHAEQFNQNINSQGFNSAMLARRSVDALRHYLAAALIFGVQAVELRNQRTRGSHDPRSHLSPATVPLYEAARSLLDRPPSRERPLIFNDDEQSLEQYVDRLATDLATDGKLVGAVQPIVASLT